MRLIRFNSTYTVRDRPMYVQAGEQVITLVPEAKVRQIGLGSEGGPVLKFVSPSALFIIDGAGVRRIGFASLTSKSLRGMLVSSALGPLQFLLFKSIRRRRGER